MKAWMLNRWGTDELTLPWTVYFWLMGVATGGIVGFLCGATFTLGVWWAALNLGIGDGR